MKALLTLALALSPCAAHATDLQDWLTLDHSVGVYSDSAASTVVLSSVDGPAKGQKAVQVKASIIQWGGLWAATLVEPSDLSKVGGLHFRAKATTAVMLVVGLKDDKKIQAETAIRILPGEWQDFDLPLSSFKKGPWQEPDAPKDGAFDAAKVTGLNFSPGHNGKADFTLGPISIVSGKVTAKTGLMQHQSKDGQALAQDFEALEVGSFGTYVDDKGSKLEVSMVADGDNHVMAMSYDIKEGGWCGAWMRVGDGWGGMDWSSAKTLSLRVKSERPEQLSFAFNDANQCAYTVDLPITQGKGWETLSVPMKAFKLNEYYQPPQAKKGAALDLTHIESCNVGLRTPGKGSVKVDDVALGG